MRALLEPNWGPLKGTPYVAFNKIYEKMGFLKNEKSKLIEKHPTGPAAGTYEKHIFFAEHGAHFDKAKRCFEVRIFKAYRAKEGFACT